MMLEQIAPRNIDFEPPAAAIEHAIGSVLDGLDRAVTSAQVATVLVSGGLLMDATSGLVALLTDDRRELRVLHAAGSEAPAAQSERRLSLMTKSPLAEVVRSGQELWLGDAGGWVALPLLIDGLVVGAVGWSFRQPSFTADQRACLRALARAGGAALYRAGLFDSERQKRMEAELVRHAAVQRDRLMVEVSATLDTAADVAQATALLAKIAGLLLPDLGKWCAFYVVDNRGRLRRAAAAHADPAQERLLKDLFARHPPAGRRLPRALRRGKSAEACDLAEASARTVGLSSAELRALRALGLKRLLVMPLRGHGHTLGTLCLATDDWTSSLSTARDIVARVAGRCAASLEYARMHDDAEQANHAREDFVAATSHELRTPLSHIKGFVSTLRAAGAEFDPETRADFLGEIERETDRLTSLVERLLDMSRIDLGGLDPSRRTPTAAATLVQSAIDQVRPSLADRQVDIHFPRDLPPVVVDAAQVERVVANLLDNAAKYSPPGAPIGITAKATGDSVILRVEDRGLGIPSEDLERIFEPFFREPSGAYPAAPGTGLGLAICRSIVRSQNGRIWAEDRPGGGSAFVFTLPVTAC